MTISIPLLQLVVEYSFVILVGVCIDVHPSVKCGGVSDFEGTITIGSSATGPQLPAIFHVESPSGDLGSILARNIGGKEFSTAPSLKYLLNQ